MADKDKLKNQEEPVNNDFEMALAEMISKAQTSVVEPLVIAAQWKDELIKLAKGKEPVSEDLEEAVNAYIGYAPEVDESSSTYGKRQAFKAGANWQKQQMMKEAISGHVGQTINGMLRALSDETFGDMGFTAGDKVKLIIIKED